MVGQHWKEETGVEEVNFSGVQLTTEKEETIVLMSLNI